MFLLKILRRVTFLQMKSVVKPAKSREKQKGPLQERKTKKSRFTGSSYVNQLQLGKQCCSNKCLTTVLACEEVEECLNLFWENTEEEQRVFILDYLYFNKNTKDTGKPFYEYKVNGKGVCHDINWLHCKQLAKSADFDVVCFKVYLALTYSSFQSHCVSGSLISRKTLKMGKRQRQVHGQDTTEDRKHFYLPKHGLKHLWRQWLTVCPMNRKSTYHLVWPKKKSTGCTRKKWGSVARMVNL